MDGPFVMNTREELVQAFDDYQHGRLGTIPVDAIRRAGRAGGVRGVGVGTSG